MSFVLLGILNSQAAGAGGAGAYDLLETTTLTSSASSVSFTGLGSYSDYKHLQIRAVSRTNLANIGGAVKFVFNSDTTSSYAYHKLSGDGSSVSSADFINQTGIELAVGAGGNNPANQFATLVADLLDFSNPSKNTTARCLGGASTNFSRIELHSGAYFKTDAVTSITMTDAADFVAGSRFSLYGIKG